MGWINPFASAISKTMREREHLPVPLHVQIDVLERTMRDKMNRYPWHIEKNKMAVSWAADDILATRAALETLRKLQPARQDQKSRAGGDKP